MLIGQFKAMHCNAVHCLPDVVCNRLVEQNRLLADDGQSTPGMDEDDNNDEDDVDDGKNDEKGKKGRDSDLDHYGHQVGDYLTKGTLSERMSLPSISREPSSRS